MLLTGCAALGLLEEDDGRYVNSPLAEEFLVRGKPYYFGGLVQMLDQRLYPGWGRLTEAIRTNRPTTWDPERQSSIFDGEDPQLLEVFWEAMHSLSTFTARALGEAIDLSGARRLLDVGGGSGGVRHRAVPALPRPERDGLRVAEGRRHRAERSRSGPSRSGSRRWPVTSSPTPRCPAGTTRSCCR